MPRTIAADLVDALYTATPVPTGCRVNHARGYLVEGRFRATEEASGAYVSSIFDGAEHGVLARFSSSGGDPRIREDDAEAEPRGLAVKIGDDAALVLVGHSIEGFPARDPESFLAFLLALKDGQDQAEKLGEYLAANPAAKRFGEMRQVPRPQSFTGLDYHMLHPFRLSSRDGSSRVGRLTVEGITSLCVEVDPPGADYLDNRLRRQMATNAATAALVFTPAPDNASPDDLTVAWRERSGATLLGHLIFDREAPDQDAQGSLVFDPSVLPPGIAFAGDPMIETRKEAYRLAAARRCGSPATK